MKKATVVTAALLFSIAALGQTKTITATDVSPSGSPIAFRSTVRWQPQIAGNCAITGHNNSSKTIAAWTANTNGVKPEAPPTRNR